jgi:ectoine hydroxylase-related dioxygenase (phytanoyl-CoA dioxygenase family)
VTAAPFTPAEIDGYRRDGFLIRRGYFGAGEVARWTAECERLWQEVSNDLRNARVQWRDRVDGGRVADRIDPVLDLSPAYRELADDPRLLGAAELLLEGTAAVFKAKLITKRPGTAGYGLHQDYPYWEPLGLPADAYVNVLVAFDQFDEASGATEVFPGLHRAKLPAAGDAPLDADASAVEGRPPVLFELEPGGVVFFHSLLPHRSAPNRGNRPRRGLFLTYLPSRHAGLDVRYEQVRLDKAR